MYYIIWVGDIWYGKSYCRSYLFIYICTTLYGWVTYDMGSHTVRVIFIYICTTLYGWVTYDMGSHTVGVIFYIYMYYIIWVGDI